MARARSFFRDQSGVAAAEMALATPLLVVLMFGAFELGSYFWAEHKVIKAVRDGARYASRVPFTEFTGCTPSSTAIDKVRNVTRTGQVASGGTPLLHYWTEPTTITITSACYTTNADASVTYDGIYAGAADGAPVVTVTAAVPYTPFFGTLGIANATLTLNATAQATVNGA